MPTLTAKTATIFIASGSHNGIYHSTEEIPPELRRKLMKYTRGENSGTILIADKRGQERMIKAFQESPYREQMNAAGKAQPLEKAPLFQPVATRSRAERVRSWLGLLLPFSIGLSLWLLIDAQF